MNLGSDKARGANRHRGAMTRRLPGEYRGERSEPFNTARSARSGVERSSQRDDDAAATGIGSPTEGPECGHAPEVGVSVISNRRLVAPGLQ